MMREIDSFARLALGVLIVWAILAGLGFVRKGPLARWQGHGKTRNPAHPFATGDKWGVPVVQAPDASTDLAFPAAPIM